MRVFVAGSTGLIGRRLCARLRSEGCGVIAHTRDAARARAVLGEGVEVATGGHGAVDGADAVVNLAGENLFARRWSRAQKEVLRSSRVQGTRRLAEAIRAAREPPRVLVSGSAIGYYGFRGDEVLDETSPPGDDFLSRLCREWEEAAREVEAVGTRVVLLRTGVVLDPAGGALARMLIPFRLCLGGPVGSGRQWVSWVHAADLVDLVLAALQGEEWRGPVNGTAPSPVPNGEFSRALGRALGRPCWAPVNGLVLRVAMGEVADLVRRGQRVVPRRALELGHAFRFPTVDAALADLVGPGAS
ncbi:MAG: TIGR01777 family protein [Planctomycetes bacterium]|nr:TIGR01777 family protein [Planctomycetota bacterium]